VRSRVALGSGVAVMNGIHGGLGCTSTSVVLDWGRAELRAVSRVGTAQERLLALKESLQWALAQVETELSGPTGPGKEKEHA
jgi:hypothetical protein